MTRTAATRTAAATALTSTAPTPSARPGLARCVGDVQLFLDRYWGRSPQHCVGADAHGFADLFSLDDVDTYVASSAARLPGFRLVRDGTPVDPGLYTQTARIGGQPVTGVAAPGRVFEEFRTGATIVFQGLHRSAPAITRFCRSLEVELGHAVQANAYVTPAGARGLGVHYDTHDVFVLQLAGTKQWSVHPPVLENPLPSQPWKGTADDAGAPCLTLDLQAGDSLYVPRGFLHSARAQEDLSAHLTIGVVITTWFDVLRDVVAGATDEPAFRQALPPGWADPEGQADGVLVDGITDALGRLRTWLDEVAPAEVAASATRRFWAARPPILAGHLHQLRLVDGLDDDSHLRRREGSACLVVEGLDDLTVVLGDRELRMPTVLMPVVARVAAAWGPFRLGDLADLLDGPSRLVLARRLVIEGLLEIVPVA